jgi:hypothetical protein
MKKRKVEILKSEDTGALATIVNRFIENDNLTIVSISHGSCYVRKHNSEDGYIVYSAIIFYTYSDFN